MDIKKIIKETRGIVESAIPYTHAILNEMDKEIEYFISSNDSKYETTIEIPYRNLARYIDDDDFEDFPIVKLNVDLEFIFSDRSPAMFYQNTGLEHFSIGAGAWPIYAGSLGPNASLSQRIKPEGYPVSKERRESIDRALIVELEFEITFYKGFTKNEMQIFDRELKSVIFHEMMHIYEGYKNKKIDFHVIHSDKIDVGDSKKPKTSNQTTKSYLEKIPLHGIPSELHNVMQNLFKNYYFSLPYEVKAITHEMYPFVSDMTVDEFFNSFQGQRIRELMEFDYEEFYELLQSESLSYFNKIGKEPNQEIIDGFLNQIRLRIQKGYKTMATERHEVIDEKFLKQKDLKSLVKYMSKQINNGGKKLFKNVGKLYSLKAELNEH